MNETVKELFVLHFEFIDLFVVDLVHLRLEADNLSLNGSHPRSDRVDADSLRVLVFWTCFGVVLRSVVLRSVVSIRSAVDLEPKATVPVIRSADGARSVAANVADFEQRVCRKDNGLAA